MPPVREDSVFENLDELRAAVVATRLADMMGLAPHTPGTPIDADTLRTVATAAARAGVAEHVAVGEAVNPYRLLEALEASPLPDAETHRLAALFGYPRLVELAGASEPSLRRYAAGERAVPDRVAQRVHSLAIIAAVLRGSFNDFGVRRWFERPRTALGERAAAALLRGDWAPDDSGPQAVARLAADLLT